MAALIVFDDGLGRLAPMTDLRAAFEVRTGALTTLERIETTLRREASALIAPPEIAALVRERLDRPVNPPARDGGGETLFVSGRCALLPVALGALAPGEALIEAASGHIIGARLAGDAAAQFAQSPVIGGAIVRREHAEPCLIHHPSDVIRFRDSAMAIDLVALAAIESQALPDAVIHIGEGAAAIDPTAIVYPTAVLDAEKGPIVIGADAVVRPGAIICGPAYVGAGSTIIDRAHIKANTAIGPACKVGGEVGGTIFQGLANKSHEGHLGDSWVGEWVNFGAGTTNSNLLNTYGEVVMKSGVEEPPHRTGLTFLGCIVGDHVKMAIMTRIMTGAVFGTGAMIATTAPPPATVDRFAWLTDAGAQRYRLEKFLEVMSAVMGRRKCEASEAYVERVRSLHAGAAAARPVESGR